MSDNSEYTIHVNTADFTQKVIDASHDRVVVVDFWAEWCGPCKMIGPILEKVVASFDGRVILAKLNVDQNQELAMQYRIQSIPAVKIFSDGAVREEFVGVLPEHEVAAIITAVAGDELGQSVQQADIYLSEERLAEAEALYSSVLDQAPGHSGACIGLARVAIMQGDTDRAHGLLSEVDESDARYDEAKSLLGTLEFIAVCNASGDMESCRARAERNPDDLDALYTLGCCYAAEGSFEEALKAFLSIVQRNSGFGDGKARIAMITLFTMLGQDSELTKHYREQLARALF